MNRVPPPKPPRLQREFGVDDSMEIAATNDLSEAINSAVDDENNTKRYILSELYLLYQD